MEYPVGSGIEHLFGGGPIIGGIVAGAKRVSTGYNTESNLNGEFYGNPNGADSFFVSSIMNPDAHNRRGFDDDRDGKIDEDELDGTDNDGDWNAATDILGCS